MGPTRRRACDPAGTGEVMDAPAGGGESGVAPSPADVAAEEQAWDEAMHQAASLAKAQGKLPGAVEETVRGAHASTVDWRSLLRRYMIDAAKRDYSWSLPNRRFIDSGLYLPSIRSEGIDTIAVIVDTSGSLPAVTLAAFWTELREIATELQPERVILLQVDAAVQDAAEYAASDLPDEIAIKGRGGTDFRPGFAWLERERHPAGRLPLPHRHAVLELSRDRAGLRCRLGKLRGASRRLEPRAVGRAHPDRALSCAPGIDCVRARALPGTPPRPDFRSTPARPVNARRRPAIAAHGPPEPRPESEPSRAGAGAGRPERAVSAASVPSIPSPYRGRFA